MKMTSILTTVAASASLMMASTAFSATEFSMTGAAAIQTLTWSGCKTLKTSDSPFTVTFDDAGSPGDNMGTYSIVDSVANTVLQGTWFKLDGKTPTSPYTVYLLPEVYAPGPYDSPTPPAGALDDFLDQLEITAQSPAPAGMTCTIKNGGSQASAKLIVPSTVIKKSTLVVKTLKDGSKSGTLTFQAAGKQASMFTSAVPSTKTKPFTVKLMVTGVVTP